MTELFGSLWWDGDVFGEGGDDEPVRGGSATGDPACVGVERLHPIDTLVTLAVLPFTTPRSKLSFTDGRVTIQSDAVYLLQVIKRRINNDSGQRDLTLLREAVEEAAGLFDALLHRIPSDTDPSTHVAGVRLIYTCALRGLRHQRDLYATHADLATYRSVRDSMDLYAIFLNAVLRSTRLSDTRIDVGEVDGGHSVTDAGGAVCADGSESGDGAAHGDGPLHRWKSREIHIVYSFLSCIDKDGMADSYVPALITLLDRKHAEM